MTKQGEGAQVDKDAVAADLKLRQSYGSKVCPVMSIGADKFGDDPGLLTGLGEAAQNQGPKEASVIPCVGPACMFFCVTSQDAAGRPNGGGCGLALIPSGLMALQHTIAAIHDAVVPNPNNNKKA